MSTSDEFEKSADLAAVNESRFKSDLNLVDQHWAANGAMLNRIKTISGLRTDEFTFASKWQVAGGPKKEDPAVYDTPGKGVILTCNAGGKISSLSIMLNVGGYYRFIYSGDVKKDTICVTNRNQAGNMLNSWLTDVGSAYNIDMISMLQRQTDAVERRAASARSQERLGK
jgi:hypothetical protein